MKKFLVFLLMILFVPVNVIAEENEYVPESLEEAIKAEDIEADLGDYSSADNKITVYLFRGKGCVHCKNFLKYVSSELIKTHGQYFNFVSYEVWRNPGNKALWKSVGNQLGVEKNTSVPFIVIGDKYIKGYSERRNEEIMTAIMDLYNEANSTGDKKDVVSKVIEGGSFSQDENNSQEVNGFLPDDVTLDKDDKFFSFDLLIKVLLSVCSAGLAVGLIVLLRRKNILK